MKTKLHFFILCAISIFYASVVSAQERGMQPVILKIDGKTTTLYRQSYALVIGVSKYTSGWPSLPGVESDVTAVVSALEKNGFNVTKVLNPQTRADLETAIENFINRHGQDTNSRLLFYFALHGHTIKMSYGESLGYLCPANAPDPNTNKADFITKALPMEAFDLFAKKINSKHALFLFDACFAGQVFSATRAAPEIIQYKTRLPVRQFITSGDADETVPDVSIFRRVFVQALEGYAEKGGDGYLTGSELGEYLQEQVVNLSNGTQHPQYGKIRNIYLNKGDFVFVVKQNTAKPPDEIIIEPEKPRIADASFIPAVVSIPGGTFLMGSNDGEDDEKPVHRVTVSGFSMGKYEVTVSQFKKFIDETGHRTDADKDGGSYMWTGSEWEKRAGVTWRCDAEGNARPQNEYDHPVIHVSWNDAVEYCRWLSGKTGNTYRLPTEAEWEYAAGNGAKHTRYSWGNGEPWGKNGGNVADEAAKRKFSGWTIFSGYDDGYVFTSPVGTYNPNEFGLYDMTGNVWEWCSDWYGAQYYQGSPASNPEGPSSGSDRVFRGGGWLIYPQYCRTSYRSDRTPGYRNYYLGFRLVFVP
ncbi:MAG: SUMF1/EgtB/PvdO family nonheme iron enzyme [Bacteroidetes bacterium]|nr:SUMF1/EgtB/PvdO family nonheme iron enzyme [Bacteroidota bacterium]